MSIREMNEDGRPVDGKPILPNDIFRTYSGGTTTPFPEGKREKVYSEWTIHNAKLEAIRRNDKYMSTIISGVKIQKSGHLTTSDIDSLNIYLFQRG